MEALLKAAKEADSQIAAIYSAFGAPGDYGYESREGKALFALYKFQVEINTPCICGPGNALELHWANRKPPTTWSRDCHEWMP